LCVGADRGLRHPDFDEKLDIYERMISYKKQVMKQVATVDTNPEQRMPTGSAQDNRQYRFPNPRWHGDKGRQNILQLRVYP